VSVQVKRDALSIQEIWQSQW